MIVIGLTGGIASGKSSIAAMMAGRGMVHVDADKLVHRLMKHDAATKAEIAALVPEALVHHRIDRAVLAQHVARDASLISKLEKIIHPRVRLAEMQAIAQAQRQRQRAVLLDVPLLFESGLDEVCDIIITAQATPKLQWQRSKKRPGMTREKFDTLVARQWSDAERAAHADVVIHTAMGKAHTRKHVQKLLKKLALR